MLKIVSSVVEKTIFLVKKSVFGRSQCENVRSKMKVVEKIENALELKWQIKLFSYTLSALKVAFSAWHSIVNASE